MKSYYTPVPVVTYAQALGVAEPSAEYPSASSENIPSNWQRYLNLLRDQGIHPNRWRYYCRAVERLIRVVDGRSLATLSSQDIQHFLHHLGMDTTLQDWQFRQSVDAVRLLLVDLLAVPTALSYDWEAVTQLASTIDANHATLARSSSATEAVKGKSLMTGASPWLERLVEQVRLRHYAIRTERAYLDWVSRFLTFHLNADISELEDGHVKQFIEHLVLERKVSVSTQKVALNALVFFYKNVVGRELVLGEFVQSRRPKRLPVVLSRQEVEQLLAHMKGVHALMAGLMYGTGMRLMECVRLRVGDIDFDRGVVVVREAKGGEDRVAPLPKRYVDALQAQLRDRRDLHHADLVAGVGEAYLPEALRRKLGSSVKDWHWQYVFASQRLSSDPHTGVTRRHHIHETALQRAISNTAREAGIAKRVAAMCYGIRLQRIYWRRVAISGHCSSCLAMRMCRLR